MRMLKYVLPVLAAAVSSMAFANNWQAEDRQMDAIQRFIDSKDNVNVRDKSADMTISGDVRFIFESVKETGHNIALDREVKYRGSQSDDIVDGKFLIDTQGGNAVLNQVGTFHRSPVANELAKGQINLKFNYSAQSAWVNTWIQFAHNHGNVSCGSGNWAAIRTREAYIGYRLMEQGTSMLDLMAGRITGYMHFNSEVMFGSNFDGLFLHYSNAMQDVGDLYVKAGAHLIDSATDHYGYVGELGLNNIADTGLRFSYSFTAWKKQGNTVVDVLKDEQGNPVNQAPFPKFVVPATVPPTIEFVYLRGDVLETDRNQAKWSYRISQLALAYDFDKEMLGNDLQVYGAYGRNHSAVKIVDNKREDYFWYAGAEFGKLEKAHDWAIEFMYQDVRLNSIPSFDLSQGGNGGLRTTFDIYETGDTVSFSGYPETNYKGFVGQVGYNVTDNLNVGLNYWDTKTAKNKIGNTDLDVDRDHKFRRFTAQVVYAF